MSKQTVFNRRKVIQGLGLTATGAAILSFQNCSNVNFKSATAKPGNNNSLGKEEPVDPTPTPDGTPVGPSPTPGPISPNCNPVMSIFNCPSKAPTSAAGVAQVNGKPVNYGAASNDVHNVNPGFFVARYFDHKTGTQKDQFLLTVDVGNSPGNGQFHSGPTNDTSQFDIITDIYVFNQSDGSLLFWKRLNVSDESPSAMFLLDATLMALKPKLAVVTHCLLHGYWGKVVDLNSTPMAYGTAVVTHNAALKHGGSSLRRPFVSVSSNGGQSGLDVQKHAPDFSSVTSSVVEVRLGGSSSRHGYEAGGYVTGGALYDQNSNLLTKMVILRLSDSGQNHVLTFDKLNLNARGVKILRAVVFDSKNGMMAGFYVR